MKSKNEQKPKIKKGNADAFLKPIRLSKEQIKALENSPALKRKHDEAREFLKTAKFPQSFLDNLKYSKMVHRKSPFKFTEPVKGRQYRNRKIELQEVISKLKDPALVFIGDYKGFGRTSFAYKLSEEMNRSGRMHFVVYVNLAGIQSELNMFAKFGLAIDGTVYGFENKIATGKPLEIERHLKEMRARLDRDDKQKVLLILDDLDKVSNLFPHRQLEELFQAAWKNRKWLSICVLLRPTMELRIFVDRLEIDKSKLRQLGLITFLDNIADHDWYNFISSRFKKNNKFIDKETTDYLITKMNGIPRRIQQLAHFLFISSKSKITKRTIDGVIQKVVDLNRHNYNRVLGKLNNLETSVLLRYVGGKQVNIPVPRAGRTYHKLQDIISIWSCEPFFFDPFFEHYLRTDKVSQD